jgi:hypothetical protein
MYYRLNTGLAAYKGLTFLFFGFVSKNRELWIGLKLNPKKSEAHA